MPSQDQAVDIPFSGGMAEGAAPFVFNGPFVELAEDCVISKEGAYVRLPGGSKPTTITGLAGGSRGLAVFDSTLVQHSTSGPQQYNETRGTWRASTPRGFVPTQVRTDPVIRQSYASVYNTAIAVSSNGYELYCWDEQTPTTELLFGRTWLAKKIAMRDPSGGWCFPPTSVSGATNPGHQVIAIGANFLIAHSNSAGFQVARVTDASTDGAQTQILTNATGASVLSTTYFGSVHDSCLATGGAYAYFLVSALGSATSYVYTLSATAQQGTATTYAGTTGLGNFALAVDNAKVYIAETVAAGGVRLDKVTEAAVTSGGATTNIGSFTLVSGVVRGMRVRMIGGSNAGVHIAVEGVTTLKTTDLALFTGANYTSYGSLPAATYVEMGFLPTSDVIGSYTPSTDRAFAHGYALGSGMCYNALRGPQVLLMWTGQIGQGSLIVKQVAAPNSVGAWLADIPAKYYGGVWAEVITQTTPNAQGADSAKLRIRSLARVGWDTAQSDQKIVSEAAGTFAAASYVHMNYEMNSFSNSTGLKLAFTALVTNESSFTTLRGLDRCTIDIAPTPPLNVTSHGDMFFDGGCQDVWDGANSLENTPHFPPAVAWVPTEALYTGDPWSAMGDVYAGGPQMYPNPATVLFTQGYTDTYHFYWEYADAEGRLHRSAVTSLEIKQVLDVASPPYYSVGVGAQFPTVGGYFTVLPPLSSNGANISSLRLCCAYQSFLDGTAGFEGPPSVISKYTTNWEFTTGGSTSLLQADAGRVSLGVRLVPNLLSLTIYETSQLPLYTDGGVLQAEASPSPASITSTRDRLWAISSDDRRKLYYTKPLEAGIAPEFNSALTVALPADAGEGVAVLTVDDKPVVLCERGIYVIVGDGPNAIGTQGDFSPQVVQSDTGCSNKNSAVPCDYGAFFQGSAGIYLLDRGLNVSLISQGVQDRALLAINKAVAVPVEKQVRFGLTAGGILVYHYDAKAWTVLNKTAYDAVVWDGFYTRIYSESTYSIHSTDSTTYVDSQSNIIMRLRTAWIKADKMQGFARFKKVQLLHNQEDAAAGSYGIAVVTAYFNYEYSPTGNMYYETSTIESVDRLPVTSGLRSQIEAHIGRQKSQSIKFDITCSNYDSKGAGTYFPPISFEGLTLVVGTITNTQFRHLKTATKT